MGLLLLVVLLYSLCDGATVYVDPAGTNATVCGSTWETACQNIFLAFGNVQADGDSITIRKGVVLGGPSNVGLTILQKSLSINGESTSVLSTLDGFTLGPLQSIFTYNGDEIGSQPQFNNLKFHGRGVTIGKSGATFTNCNFDSPNMLSGPFAISYTGHPSDNNHVELGLTLNGVSFNGLHVGVQMQDGSLQGQGLTFSQMTEAGITVTGKASVSISQTEFRQCLGWGISASNLDGLVSVSNSRMHDNTFLPSCIDVTHSTDVALSLSSIEFHDNTGGGLLRMHTVQMDPSVTTNMAFNKLTGHQGDTFVILNNVSSFNLLNNSFTLLKPDTQKVSTLAGVVTITAGSVVTSTNDVFSKNSLVAVSVSDQSKVTFSGSSFVANTGLSSGAASVVQVLQSSQAIFLDPQPLSLDLQSNQFPQIICNQANLTGNVNLMQSFVSCISCAWSGCSYNNGPSGVAIFLLVAASIGGICIIAVLAFFGHKFYKTRVRRMEYKDLQIQDDL